MVWKITWKVSRLEVTSNLFKEHLDMRKSPFCSVCNVNVNKRGVEVCPRAPLRPYRTFSSSLACVRFTSRNAGGGIHGVALIIVVEQYVGVVGTW